MRNQILLYAKNQVLAGNTIEGKLVGRDPNGKRKHCVAGWMWLKVGLTVKELQDIDLGGGTYRSDIAPTIVAKMKEKMKQVGIDLEEVFELQDLNDSGKTEELLHTIDEMIKATVVVEEKEVKKYIEQKVVAI